MGHLFSTDVFGYEESVPLYYIQIVQGGSGAVKVLISSSKLELVESAYAEACLGYSTVFMGGICQIARPMFSEPTEPRCIMTRRNVYEAVQMLRGEPKRVAVIY
jgi:hypothetical protein